MADSIDFIGIGMVKSGTTWVSRCLSQHPQLLFSDQCTGKEIKFFDRPYNLAKGLEWYLRQFPAPEAGKKRGEYTPTYMVDENAHLEIARLFPDAKLLVTLRNPVDMLLSLHRDAVFSPWGNTVTDFSTAVLAGDFSAIKAQYGLYHCHLSRFHTVFPENSILVTLHEDIQHAAEKAIARIYAFLGVDAEFRPACLHKRVNSTVIPRSRDVHRVVKAVCARLQRTEAVVAMDHSPRWNAVMSKVKEAYKVINGTSCATSPLCPEARAKLAAYFREDIGRLESLIGRDLSSWQT